MEYYTKHPSVERGGTLYFYYMMTLLQTNNDEVSHSVMVSLKKLDIEKTQGESVPKAVTFLRAAIKFLKSVEQFDVGWGRVYYPKIPSDIIHILLTVLRTTSVPEFNSVFDDYETIKH